MKHLTRASVLLAVAALLLGGGLTALAEGSTYAIDKSHSSIVFRVKHLDIGYTYGFFRDFEGSFVVDEANPAASSVEMTVQMGSVDTNDAKRDQHLKSPDFFGVNQFPTMTFKSTSVAKTDDGKFQVTGDLTLHGVKRSATITMNKTGEGDDPWGNHRIGFEGIFSVKRSDYGMDKMLEAASDEIRIIVAIEGIRK